MFYARVPAAHSIELLPDNRVVVALSHNEEGDCIQLFDINHPNQVLFQDSLFWGHGVIWMENRQLLYALGFNELKAYSLKNWKVNNQHYRWKSMETANRRRTRFDSHFRK